MSPRQRQKAAKARAAEKPESSTAGLSKRLNSPKDAKPRNWQVSLSIGDYKTLKAAEAAKKHNELQPPRPADRPKKSEVVKQGKSKVPKS